MSQQYQTILQSEINYFIFSLVVRYLLIYLIQWITWALLHGVRALPREAQGEEVRVWTICLVRCQEFRLLVRDHFRPCLVEQIREIFFISLMREFAILKVEFARRDRHSKPKVKWVQTLLNNYFTLGYPIQFNSIQFNTITLPCAQWEGCYTLSNTIK